MSLLTKFKDAWKSRHKLGDHHHNRELAQFLPAALEIQAIAPHPLARWLARSLITLLLLGIIWACIGKVNIVASAEGKIIPSSRVKQIQPMGKGMVKAILVNEGDYVTQGQALIKLDTTLTTADKNRLQTEWHAAALNLALNQAMLSQIETTTSNRQRQPLAEKQIALRPDQLTLKLPNFATAQETQRYQHLLWQQWQQYWSQYQSLQSNLRKIQAEQAASSEIIKKLRQILPIVSKRTTTLKNLYQKDFVAETDYLQVEQERIQTQQDLAAEKQRFKQLQAAESQAREQINTHIAQTNSTLLTQIVEQQQQIATLKEELVKANDLNDKQTLYAPVAGRVQELTVNTLGGVVTEAQQLMLIVPSEQQLEVEVFLNNKDIGFVHEAMPAEIKIHTFPFTKYGVIDAQVSNISSDAIIDEQRGLIYSMHLRMAKNTITVNGKDINLMPGMAVTAEVKTGKRRIIEFFLAPLLRAKNESIRER